jgi:hypothetical protein
MKKTWKISVPPEEKERIAITYGDPADALVAIENYALYPLPEAISTWHSMVPLLKNDHWYDVTAFYSRRKADLSKEASQLLYDYNQRAFDAAKTKGGLLLYYQGVLLSNDASSTKPNLNLSFVPNCLSFCIWNSLPEAKAGAKMPEHKKATHMTSLWFDGFSIVKYQLLLKEAGQKKQLIFKIVPYQK